LEDVEEKIKGLLMKSLDMKPEEVTLTANLKDDLEMDSLEMVELEVALEKAFNIDIKKGEISNKNCVGDVVRTVQDKLKQ
jgi:acyl carrier protein